MRLQTNLIRQTHKLMQKDHESKFNLGMLIRAIMKMMATNEGLHTKAGIDARDAKRIMAFRIARIRSQKAKSCKESKSNRAKIQAPHRQTKKRRHELAKYSKVLGYVSQVKRFSINKLFFLEDKSITPQNFLRIFMISFLPKNL